MGIEKMKQRVPKKSRNCKGNGIRHKKLRHDSVVIGDIFMMKDPDFNKNSSDVPNTRTIKFDRPVIIFAICRDVVTVVPLTTKDKNYDVTYPIIIEEDKLSHAMISQIMTIDVDLLQHKMGVLNEDVFNELRRECSQYLSDGDRKHIVRTIPMIPKELDMKRFELFHVYMNKTNGSMFLIVRSEGKEMLALSVILADPVMEIVPIAWNSTFRQYMPINASCFAGHVLCNKLQLVDISFYRSNEYRDIGVEYRINERNHIINVVNDIFGIRLCHGKSKDYLTNLTMALFLAYGDNYINGFMRVDVIRRDKDEQKNFLFNPIDTLNTTANLKGKTSQVTLDKARMLINVLADEIVSSMDILTCHVELLNNAIKNFKPIIEPRIMSFEDKVDLENLGKLINPIKNNDKYFVKNIRWIARYIRNKRKNKKK